MRLRMLTAGESHGPQLTVILDGLPSGLRCSPAEINPLLAARQAGYGRGGRQQIEHDEVEFVGGVRAGLTTGAPVAMVLRNRDYENWRAVMDPLPVTDPTSTQENSRAAHAKPLNSPRPGHADLAGGLKHNTHDMRNILERASARETAARVAAGAVAITLLEECGVQMRSHVLQIGAAGEKFSTPARAEDDWWKRVAESQVRCGDPDVSKEMIHQIDTAREAKNSVGGILEVVVYGLPAGFGTYAQWDRRLDGLLAQAVCSIPGIKGVEFGAGFTSANQMGSELHDPILWSEQSEAKCLHSAGTNFVRSSNNAGGLEGGMSNGSPIVLRAVMKPISTLMLPLASVDSLSKEPTLAHRERADTCVVPAAGVIAMSMCGFVLADALLDKCGGDSLAELQRNFQGYCDQIKNY